MTSPVDLSCLSPAEEMAGEDANETDALREMLTRAELYLRSYSWCPPIAERYLGIGIAGVVAVFLFRFEKPVHQNDEWLWVIEGDLPSAYLVIDRARDPAAALGVYCDMMEEWVNAVCTGSSLDDVFPVNAPPTVENAKMLSGRVRFIRDRILPTL